MRGAFPLFFFCLLAAVPARAKGEGGRAPVAVLLVSGLGYEDLKPGRPAGTLQILAKKGMLTLLEPSVAGELTEAAAYLSVGAGVPVAAPERGGKTIVEAELTRTMADVAQDAYPFAGAEGKVVARGYRRRYGEYPPLESVAVHLGVPALRDGQKEAATAARIGALGAALKKAGLRVAVYGDWRAISVGMDERGAMYAGTMRPIAPERLAATIRESDVAIVNAETPRTLRMYAAALRNASDINLIIAAVAPSLAADEEPMRRQQPPGFLLGVGPAFAAGTIPVSRTTHLPGLVSSLDITPTIAALAGASFEGGAGTSLTAARTIMTRDSFATLATLDRQIAMRDKIGVTARVFALAWAGFFLPMGVISTLAATGLKRERALDASRAFVWVTAALPAALLLTGLIAPTSTGLYLGTAALLALLAGLLGGALQRHWTFAPLALILLLTAALVAFDDATGRTTLYRSVLFDDRLSGAQISAKYVSFGAASAVCGILLLLTSVAPAERRPRALVSLTLTIALMMCLSLSATVYTQDFWATAVLAGALPPLLVAMEEWVICVTFRSIMERNESALR